MNAIIVNTKEVQRALVIAQRTNASTPAEYLIAGAKAAMIAELKKRMQTSVVEFYFTKRDGSLRRAFGTTMPSLAATHINGRGINRDSVNTVAFWCTEKGGWRSCRYESIVKIC